MNLAGPTLCQHAAALLAGMAAGAGLYAALRLLHTALTEASSSPNSAEAAARVQACLRRRLRQERREARKWPSALILLPWRSRRERRFRQAFASLVESVTRGAEAGLPFERALRVAAESASEPARRHFLRFAGDIASGLSISVAAARLYSHMPLAELRFFELVIELQRQTGGAGHEPLANLAAMLRARSQFAARLNALTAEAKTAAAILGSLPFLAAAALGLIMPSYLEPLWSHPLGRLCLYAAAIWMLTGMFVIRIMIRLEPGK